MSNTARIVIVGGPKTGKTTLSLAALVLGDGPLPQIRHTDTTKDMDWSKASEAVVPWFDEPGPWVIEGVAAVRALRKWLASNKEGKPCDEVRVLTKPFAELSKGQITMAKGIATILKDIEPELTRRGVSITHEWPELPADAVSLAREEAAKLDAAPAGHAVGGSAVAPSSSADATPVVFKAQPGETATFGPGGTFPDAPAGEVPPPLDPNVTGPNTVSTAVMPGAHGSPRAPAATAIPLPEPVRSNIPGEAVAPLLPVARVLGDALPEVVEDLHRAAKSDSMTRMPNFDTADKDPAKLSVHELQALNEQKERDVSAAKEAAELAAAAARAPKADQTRGDKRAKQWWKDRPWQDGPNGSTGK